MDKILKNSGLLKSPEDKRDYKISMVTCSVSPSKYPEKFKLPYYRKPKNQWEVGSCVGHSLSYCREISESLQYDEQIDISAGFIYNNRKPTDYQGEGMYIRQALDQLLEFGCVSQETYPWNEHYPRFVHPRGKF